MPSISWRRLAVMAAFVAAIAFVGVLNHRAAGSVAAGGTGERVRLSEVAHASGIDFVHQSPTLDWKLAHIAPHVAALGACVSVTDVNNDNWADLYFTSSRFGAANGSAPRNRAGGCPRSPRKASLQLDTICIRSLFCRLN
ncbi:MAG: hypothetical protein ACRDGN_17010 [bacterium]